MAEKGWVSKWAFQNDALAADTEGREAMADSYILNAKIADSQITAAKLANGKVLATGVYDTSTYDACYYA